MVAPSKRKEFLPFFRPSFGEEEERELIECLRSGWITTGPRVRAFEQALGEYLGGVHVAAVSSGTAALHLALAALDVGPGHEVITVGLTWVSTANVILHQGATPVLVDVDPGTWCMEPRELARVIEARYRLEGGRGVNPESGAVLKAVVVVHYAGVSCEMEPILELGREWGFDVIEDAAHAIGTTYRARPAGTLGTLGCFSFYANKNMTTAEGGAVVGRDSALVEKVRMLALHGLAKDAWARYGKGGRWYQPMELLGFKYNMTDLAASLGLHQLGRLEGFNSRRRQLAALYDQLLAGTRGLILPPANPWGVHARHIYPIVVDEARAGITRDELIRVLGEYNIGTGVHFIPVHLHPYYQRRFGWGEGMLPVTERLYQGLVSLPLFPGMAEEDVEYVAGIVHWALEGGR